MPYQMNVYNLKIVKEDSEPSDGKRNKERKKKEEIK